MHRTLGRSEMEKEEIIRELAKRNEVNPRWIQAVKWSPNIGRPLFDSAFVASSCKTSQCFGKAAVLDPDNIRGDPGDRPASS